MVKLSAQLEAKPVERVTRTERKLMEQERIRKAKESKKEFEDLQARAKEVREKKLSNVQSIDDYQEIYSGIDPELKQFFATPQELRTSKSTRIEDNKTAIRLRITNTEKRLQTREVEFQKSMAEAPDIDLRDRQQFKRDITQEYTEDKAFLSEQLIGFKQGLSRLEAGEDLSVGDISAYAKRKGSYEKAREVERSKPKKLRVITRKIDENYIMGKLSGLTSEGQKIIRSATGGSAEVEIFSVKGGEKVQVVREKDTGKIYYTDLEGAKKGERIQAQGYTDKELNRLSNELALEGLQKRKEERDPYVEEGNFATKINRFIRKTISKIGDVQLIPIFTAGSGTTGFEETTIREVTKQAGQGAIWVAKKTFIGDIKVPVFDPKDPRSYIGVQSLQIEGVPSLKTLTKIPEQKTVKVREITDFGKEKISIKQQELALRQLEKLGIKEQYDPLFEAEYQGRFEDKYGVRLIAGDITFEEAEKQFAKSDEVKLIGKRYGKVIEKKKAGVITTETFGLVGLSLASLGIKLIPETAGELAVETALVLTATKGLALIPPKALLTTEVIFGVHGGLQLADPTLAGEKRVIGGIIAGAVGTHLGIKGIKLLKTPTIKTVKIKPPKVTLKVDTQLAKEGNIYKITKGGEIALRDKTIFKKAQQIQQIGVAGRRTVVSTRWKDILKLDPIYRGVPTSQRGTIYALRSFRGDFFYTTSGGYQKAFKLLSKSNRALLTTGTKTKLISLKGFSTPQIKEILRFSAPKVIVQTLESGELLVTGKTAKARFTYLTEQPVISVDKKLGIKTRSAKSVRDIYDVERNIIGTHGDVAEIITNVRKTTMFVSKEGGSFNIPRQAGRTEIRFVERSMVKTGEVQDFIDKIDIQGLKGNKVVAQISKTYPYQAQSIFSAFERKQLVPLKREVIKGFGKTTIIKDPYRKIVDIDIDKAQGISFKKKYFVEPSPIKRTPLSKTFAEETAVKEIKEIIKYKQPKPLTFDYVDDIERGASQVTKESRYAGTGLYERTESVVGGLDLSQSQINTALKTGITPTINIKTQIKNLINLDKAFISPATSTKLALGSLTALKTNQLLKQDLKLDLDQGLDLKANQQLKNLLKQGQALKTGQVTKQALKLSQVTTFAPTILSPALLTSTAFKPPVIPIIPIPLFFPVARSKAKKKVKDKLLLQQLAFLPDFTARSLGLDPKVLTESQALKQIRKLQTGLEIRRAVKLKPSKLLKGIPE